MYYIVGKPNCPYCDKAKKLLDNTGIDYIYEDLSESPDLLSILKNMGVRSVPAIFEYQGGFEQLINKLNNGDSYGWK